MGHFCHAFRQNSLRSDESNKFNQDQHIYKRLRKRAMIRFTIIFIAFLLEALELRLYDIDLVAEALESPAPGAILNTKLVVLFALPALCLYTMIRYGVLYMYSFALFCIR